MKIAMIGQKGIPTLFGGVERHVEEISWRLAKNGHQVFVYARSYYTPPKTEKYRGVIIIRLPSVRTKHLDAFTHTFIATWHALFKIRPEVIHYHGIGSALCLWIAKLFSPKIKIVFTFHSQDYFHQKWGKIAQTALRIGEKIGCSLADEILTVSLLLQKYVQMKYKRKSSFIPHGVNQEKYLPANLIKKWGLKKNSYILVVTRLIPHKGVHYLIKAYRGIKTDKKLVIVGPSFYTRDYERKLKEMAKNNSKIIFVGAQQGNILKELYSQAYLFTSASEQEGLPLNVMEAASFGRPLLLSNIPEHQNIFGDLPVFFKNKNVRDLRKKLIFILQNPQMACQKGKKIQEYGQKNYDWDKSVKQIISVYNKSTILLN